VSRWNQSSGVQRGSDYDVRWAKMASAGENPHGEADFLCQYNPTSVLDAGCGTGRVAMELGARGIDVVGVDLDPEMLAAARDKAPGISWHLADLLSVNLDRTFEMVALPGNVMIFVSPGTEAAVVGNLVRHLEPGGVMIAGFQISQDRLAIDDYDRICASHGLSLSDRFATWQSDQFAGGDYAVSVHRLTR
jgi:SAM-dependent methyltransferase